LLARHFIVSSALITFTTFSAFADIGPTVISPAGENFQVQVSLAEDFKGMTIEHGEVRRDDSSLLTATYEMPNYSNPKDQSEALPGSRAANKGLSSRPATFYNHGFTLVVPDSASPHDKEQTRENNRRVEAAIGAEAYREMVAALADYEDIDVRHLTLSKEDFQLAKSNNYENSKIGLCIMVQWRKKGFSFGARGDQFCGEMILGNMVEGSAVEIRFEAWDGGSMIPSIEEARQIFLAVDGSLQALYGTMESFRGLMERLAVEAAE